ncbi:MAG: VCBS repeat-containing protein [Nitrospinota bacterium]|nr:MAG: VCBS repeat-containing protein [Nitrospinota bacterium]
MGQQGCNCSVFGGVWFLVFLLLSVSPRAIAGSSPDFTIISYEAGNAPFFIQVADFDQNGSIDFSLVNRDSHNVTVFLVTPDGQGGVKVEQWSYKSGRHPEGLFAGDLDGDGDPDLVTVNLGENSFTTLLNKGKIEEYGILDLVQGTRYPVQGNPHAIWGGDFDRDGDIDLAVVVEEFHASGNRGRVLLFHNNGTGKFQAQAAVTVGTEPHALTGADLDRDGALDLIVSNKGSRTLSLLFNDGKGDFAHMTTLEVGDAPHGIGVADLDGDGDQDLAITNISAHTVTLVINRGKRRFEKGKVIPVHARFPFAVIGVDIDNDGDKDLVTANLVGDNISLLRNGGKGDLRFAQT